MFIVDMVDADWLLKVVSAVLNIVIAVLSVALIGILGFISLVILITAAQTVVEWLL